MKTAPTTAAVGHMPFKGHRTQDQVPHDRDFPAYYDQLPWCPDEYKDQYRHLKRKCGFTADKARALIEEQMRLDTSRRAHG